MVRIISFGKTELTEERFIQPKNDWIKPIGGIWGSTYILDEVYSSDWERWCIEENFGYNWKEAVIFTLKPDAKVYEIDSVQDLNNLAKAYNVHGNGVLTRLDFEAMVAAGIDAIHLTEKGQEETRFSRPYTLYGWDVESWLILNIHAIDQQRAAVRTQMQHLMDQIINAKTATGLTAAMEGFRVIVSSRGCGKLLKMQEELDELGPSQAEIKKRLKYTKNPMEIKKLNQELTAAYKRYKGGSRNGIERR